jgi:hypothetical protein
MLRHIWVKSACAGTAALESDCCLLLLPLLQRSTPHPGRIVITVRRNSTSFRRRTSETVFIKAKEHQLVDIHISAQMTLPLLFASWGPSPSVISLTTSLRRRTARKRLLGSQERTGPLCHPEKVGTLTVFGQKRCTLTEEYIVGPTRPIKNHLVRYYLSSLRFAG